MDRGTLGIVVSQESGLTPEGRGLAASPQLGLGVPRRHGSGGTEGLGAGEKWV
jgi:hypothetical protein